MQLELPLALALNSVQIWMLSTPDHTSSPQIASVLVLPNLLPIDLSTEMWHRPWIPQPFPCSWKSYTVCHYSQKFRGVQDSLGFWFAEIQFLICSEHYESQTLWAWTAFYSRPPDKYRSSPKASQRREIAGLVRNFWALKCVFLNDSLSTTEFHDMFWTNYLATSTQQPENNQAAISLSTKMREVSTDGSKLYYCTLLCSNSRAIGFPKIQWSLWLWMKSKPRWLSCYLDRVSSLEAFKVL